MPENSVASALAYAATATFDKKSKGSGSPDLCHLAGMVRIVAGYGGREVTQVAAALRGMVEDCGVSVETLAAMFGPDPARIVGKLTEDKSRSWGERKLATIDLARRCCQGVAIVLIADKIDDMNASCREAFEPGYWEKFNAGWERQMWFHQELLIALRSNSRLNGEAPEYLDLRTWKAIEELQRSFDFFRGGSQWTAEGTVFAGH
jgi:(p)ppGpp synthase/HD superfamily hydrolase